MKRTSLPVSLFFTLGLSVWPSNAGAADLTAPSNSVISRCDRPFVFGFGSWEQAPKDFSVQPEGIRIVAQSAQGGAGIPGLNVALDGYADWSPALTLTVSTSNRIRTLNLHLGDADETSHAYGFDVSNLTPGVPAQVVAEHGASIAFPQNIERPGQAAGLTNIASWILIGDWSSSAVDLVLSSVALVPPTEELRAQRAEFKRQLNREAEFKRLAVEGREKARQEMLAKGVAHPADGPTVTSVCAVAPDVVAITLQAGQHANNQLLPYAPQPGDELVEEAKDKPRHTVKAGRVLAYFPKALYRRVNEQRTRVGQLSPDGKHVFIEKATTGQSLEEGVVDEPAAYRIQSTYDPAYTMPTVPRAVFRKGKPNGYSQPLPFRYTISLRLPSPLKEGATYVIRFVGVNTSTETVTYVHKPRESRSLAVHAIQTGYRPDDPFKRAYLSFWMGVDKDGNHGSGTHSVDSFELLDLAGQSVFTGKAQLAKAGGAEEQISIHEKLDYTKAAVHRLDFSAFSKPGEYRVFVPGLGTSGPFRIATNVWEAPFKAAMQGILTQRQGIELGPPASTYQRPRTFHPDDGVEFYQLDIPYQAGQEGTRGEHMLELAKAGPLQRVDGVWGGYQDAGDWDTLGHHLSATYDLLGLYDLNPAAFARMKLSLPAEEAKNNLPDILDEALWQMALWKRLQLPDGGVRGGYGDGWGCYSGETSSMLKYAGVYAVDHETTLHYAAAAARAARVLAAYDKQRSVEYLDSAQRAWNWAETHAKESDPTYQKVLGFHKELPKKLRDKRAMAAVELLFATGNPAYDAAFKQSTELAAEAKLYLEQPEADFAYARLPQRLGDLELKKRAVQRITAYADHAIEFSRKNAFDIITGHRTDMPMIFVSRFFSTPGAGGLALIHAYELTQKPAYLAAAVQGANYSLGANPDNLSYCTGVGDNAQHFNFIVDALVTGQARDLIVGHIPYGQGNEGNAMSRSANGWVQQWLLNFGPTKKMVPNWYDWPVNEQYIDFARYPLHNENCFNQTTVPAACYWFYLATRL
ncbi:MAG: glycoside hydrolase family 9 protein [Verrucomicrobia bacterium]|nr:glycoside hydrolase family 9 protein [Verrucomicrobiota bacterium]